MNEATRCLYLRFVVDRIKTSLEAIAASRGESTDYYIDMAERDLQQALEKLRLVQEDEARRIEAE